MNVNRNSDNITLNSCQYTPVYLIQNNSITQARSYVLAPPVEEEQRPVTNNLKLFYENSGNIENSIILKNVQYVSNNTPANKPVQEPVGNNLKLASFLVPKKDATNQQYIATISNKILKPTVSSSNTNVLPNVNIVTPKVNGARSKANSNTTRSFLKPRILPKIKPKEQTREQSKHTSVHLLNFDGSYHSLNQLNDEQMKLVKKALENFHSNPEKTTLKPSYDTDSNTRIVYKVVSPKDLKVVGKNKIIIKASPVKKEDIIKEIANDERKEELIEVEHVETKAEPVAEVQRTRSGRTVKLPKHIQQTQEQSPPKARKKTTVMSCLQCSLEFTSLYRLQRHYERHPSHIPSKSHTNLYQCLLAVVGSGNDEEKTAIFIQELEKFIAKLKSVLPCLLRNYDGLDTVPCNFNEDVGRLFGVSPGKYSINVDALNCNKNSDGNCSHDPIKIYHNSDLNKPSQIWLSKHQEETANINVKVDNEGDDCARINSVDKWPIKRVWENKIKKTDKNLKKKIKLSIDVGEPLIELGNESSDYMIENNKNHTDVFDIEDKTNEIQENHTSAVNDMPILDTDDTMIPTTSNSDIKKPKGSHSQFYSTHFDIRSSPMKPSSTVFNKFQIMPLKMDAPVLRPLSFALNEVNECNQESNVSNASDNSLDLNGMFRELTSSANDTNTMVNNELNITNDVDVVCKETDVLDRLAFDTHKDWAQAVEQTDNCMQTSSLIAPAMVHVNGSIENTATNYVDTNYNSSCTNNDLISFNTNPIANNENPVNNDNLISENRESLNQGALVLNFLESLGNDCLSCPETELRNNSIDFSLDLFSFHNS